MDELRPRAAANEFTVGEWLSLRVNRAMRLGALAFFFGACDLLGTTTPGG